MATIVKEGIFEVMAPPGGGQPRVTARGFVLQLADGESEAAFLTQMARNRLQLAARFAQPLIVLDAE